jgi:hypothetical protein
MAPTVIGLSTRASTPIYQARVQPRLRNLAVDWLVVELNRNSMFGNQTNRQISSLDFLKLLATLSTMVGLVRFAESSSQ